jgi:FkbM family methyltransferase
LRFLRKHINFALMGRSLFAVQARMCPTPGARARFLFIYVVLVIRALSGRPAKKARRLRICAAGRERDWWVADPMEMAALSEVFVAGEYGDFLPEHPRLILDAGANVGSATLWFRERFPDARVICVEPNPKAFERLARNVGDEPNVQLVNAALSDRDGKAFFGGEPMTPVGRLQDHGGPSVFEVDTLTLATVRERFAADAQIDMFKLDVEGAEWQVLTGPLTNVRAIAIEIHEPVPGGREPDEVLQQVAEREGFELRRGYSNTAAPENLRWLLRTEVAEPLAAS